MIEALFSGLVGRAAAAGVGLALLAGPLGCFVLWRRMAYFGEATAHAALLGVALGLLLGASAALGAAAAALGLAIAVAFAAQGRRLAVDSLLGVFAHGALALGLVAVGLTPGARGDLMGYLFGDILFLSVADVALIWAAAALVGAGLGLFWSRLLTATLSADLAAAEGARPDALTLGLMVAVALVVALAMQVVGLLLVAALLVLPPAAARPLAATPEAMAAIAAAIGAASALLGLILSLASEAPAGPSIVAAAFGLFLVAHLAAAARRAV